MPATAASTFSFRTAAPGAVDHDRRPFQTGEPLLDHVRHLAEVEILGHVRRERHHVVGVLDLIHRLKGEHLVEGQSVRRLHQICRVTARLDLGDEFVQAGNSTTITFPLGS